MDKIRKWELWAATAIYLITLFALLSPVLSHESFEAPWYIVKAFRRNNVDFDGFLHYLMPMLIIASVRYVVFIAFNNFLVPQFFEKRAWGWAVIGSIFFLWLFWCLTMVAYTYSFGYRLGDISVQAFHNICAARAFVSTFTLALAYSIYYGLKQFYFQYYHDIVVESRFWKKIPSDIIVLIAVWLMLTILMIVNGMPARMHTVLWGGMVFIAAYGCYAHYVFRPVLQKRRRVLQVLPAFLVIAVLSSFLACLLVDIFTRIAFMQMIFLALISINILVVAPLSLVVTALMLSRKNEVLHLEKALGRSSANLDFLRSQINPHFLFNALNTLYGTALQENASRTSEGVQRLGDMMRFMLHENHQEKIELTKEVAYLENYIALQRLRTQTSPDINIEVKINESDCDHEIAPMLLIPFVENAFKHGISLRSRSWIVISLSCDSSHIYFDAYNSIHTRPENDPEKHSLGIGLNNVRNRLALLYPGKHELSIRETATEFFVHLTITTTAITTA